MYRVTTVVFVSSTDDMKAKKRASISDIINEYLADNPHLEPLDIASEFTPYGTPDKGMGEGTYTISCWFKYTLEDK